MSKRGRAGFTLLELLLVIVIIGVLAAIILPNFAGRGEEARRAAAQADLASIELALDMYESDIGSYPTTQQGLQALTLLLWYALGGKPTRDWRRHPGVLESGWWEVTSLEGVSPVEQDIAQDEVDYLAWIKAYLAGCSQVPLREFGDSLAIVGEQRYTAIAGAECPESIVRFVLEDRDPGREVCLALMFALVVLALQRFLPPAGGIEIGAREFDGAGNNIVIFFAGLNHPFALCPRCNGVPTDQVAVSQGKGRAHA